MNNGLYYHYRFLNVALFSPKTVAFCPKKCRSLKFDLVGLNHFIKQFNAGQRTEEPVKTVGFLL